MTTSVSAYIWTPPNTFTEHVVADYEAGDVTKCGVSYFDLPDNSPPVLEGDGSLSYDKPWYYDHDRDDVIKCMEGCFRRR